MPEKVYTREEMRAQVIDTSSYVFMDKPDEVVGTLELKAEARNGMLRLFFSFSDGRKIITPVFWWQRSQGLFDIPVGVPLKLCYVPGKDGMVVLKSATPLSSLRN